VRTLLVAKRKGGVGATTLCRELGVRAARELRVCFIDLDPQASLIEWWRAREDRLGVPQDANPGLAFAAPQALEHTLRALQGRGCGLAVVDTPPSEHRWMPAALALADLVLLPTRPTTDDLRALGSTLDTVEEAERPFMLCPCQVPPGRSRLYDEALPLLAERGRVAPPIRLRAAFPVAAADGRAAVEGPAASPAAAEVEAVWRVVARALSRLGGKQARRYAGVL
jgi:chromosome partitioning protein